MHKWELNVAREGNIGGHLITLSKKASEIKNQINSHLLNQQPLFCANSKSSPEAHGFYDEDF